MKSFDAVIVGAGPAGMAAAIAARRSGATVLVIDDNHAAGGQIWRGGGPANIFKQFSDSGADLLTNARVIDGDATRKRITIEAGKVFHATYSKLILATGARELFLPFPGWTLPNVFGVGGLQALTKSGLSVAGKRVIVAGSGPLLLSVAAHLKKSGAFVPLIAEQASWRSLGRFGRALLRYPDKIRQAVKMRRSTLGTSYMVSSWVTQARGVDRVEEVSLLHNGNERRERCDYLAVAYGFVPNTELAELMGCEVRDNLVQVNAQQQTTVSDIYCAGEPTGLGGVDESLIEGEIAGCAATDQLYRFSKMKTARFSRALNEAFALRPELKAAVTDETIVCRCEDVILGRLRGARSWREAKLHFRCGMGPCQGRICGPALQYLMGWRRDSVRLPIFPVPLQSLISREEISQV